MAFSWTWCSRTLRPFFSSRGRLYLCARHRRLWQTAWMPHGQTSAGGEAILDLDPEEEHDDDSAIVLGPDELATTLDTTSRVVHQEGAEYGDPEQLVDCDVDASLPPPVPEVVEGVAGNFRKKPERIAGEVKRLVFTVGRRRFTVEEIERGALGESRLQGLLDTSEIDTVEKEDNFEQIMDMKAFRSMRRISPPETKDLLHYLRENFTIGRGDLYRYENSIPSVLGSTVESVQKRVKELEAVGFNEHEVNYLLPFFPPFLQVDLNNVHAVFRLLEEYQMNPSWVRGLVRCQLHIFLQEEKEVRRKLTTLRDLGLHSRDIANLMRHYPLLFCCPLSQDAQTTIKAVNDAGFGPTWIRKSLIHNLRLRPGGIKLGPGTREVADILREYHVDPEFVLLACPQLFKMSVDQLLSIISTLMGRPLNLNMRDVQLVLSRTPDVISSITDTESLHNQLLALTKVYQSASKAHQYILRVPAMIDPHCGAEEKAMVLEELGFTPEQCATLAQIIPSLMLQNTHKELEPKMRLLLSIPGVTPSVIASSSDTVQVNMLATPLNSLQALVNYAQKYNESLLHASKLQELFASSDKEFAKLCGQTVAHLHSEGGRRQRIRQGRAKVARDNATKSEAPGKDTTNVPVEIREVGGIETQHSQEIDTKFLKEKESVKSPSKTEKTVKSTDGKPSKLKTQTGSVRKKTVSKTPVHSTARRSKPVQTSPVHKKSASTVPKTPVHSTARRSKPVQTSPVHKKSAPTVSKTPVHSTARRSKPVQTSPVHKKSAPTVSKTPVHSMSRTPKPVSLVQVARTLKMKKASGKGFSERQHMASKNE